MQVKTIIFDFDGTMANTMAAGIAIYNLIAPEYNCKQVAEQDKDILRNKKPQEFLKQYGISFWKLPKLLLRIKKELGKQITDIKIQPGIEKIIRQLKNKGHDLGIMTSNSEKNIKAFLNRNNLDQYFNFIYAGKNVYGKNKILNKIIKQKKLNKQDVIYIGDETRDIEACKKIGLSIIAVTWGFNKKEILEAQNPDYLVDEPEEILDILN